MSWLDTLLGRTRPKPAKLDALFALPGAAVTLEVAVGLRSSARAGVSFKPASGQAFARTDTDLEQLIGLAAEDAGTQVTAHHDRFGYRWVVLDDPDLEDLVTATHVVNATLEGDGFGSQLLCSVFGFVATDQRPCHLVYLYKRGTFYPFAPRGDEKRDHELELQVRGAVGSELPVEKDLARWFPLWDLPL